MSNVLYFISEIPSLYVFVWEGGSSWHNHLPKCAKIHFSEFQILKFSRGKAPAPPMRGCHPAPIPSPQHVSGAWKALKRLVTLLWRLLNFILFLIWGEPWSLRCVLRHHTLLSKCLCSGRCLNDYMWLYYLQCGSHSGLMVSGLIPGASGLDSSPDWDHCVVFLGKTLNSHSAPLHPGV